MIKSHLFLTGSSGNSAQKNQPTLGFQEDGSVLRKDDQEGEQGGDLHFTTFIDEKDQVNNKIQGRARKIVQGKTPVLHTTNRV